MDIVSKECENTGIKVSVKVEKYTKNVIFQQYPFASVKDIAHWVIKIALDCNELARLFEVILN